jgi:hypothetical protein
MGTNISEEDTVSMFATGNHSHNQYSFTHHKQCMRKQEVLGRTNRLLYSDKTRTA